PKIESFDTGVGEIEALAVHEDDVFLVPRYGKSVFKVNVAHEDLVKYSLPFDDEQIRQTDPAYAAVTPEGELFVVYSVSRDENGHARAPKVWRLDPKSEKVEEVRLNGNVKAGDQLGQIAWVSAVNAMVLPAFVQTGNSTTAVKLFKCGPKDHSFSDLMQVINVSNGEPDTGFTPPPTGFAFSPVLRLGVLCIQGGGRVEQIQFSAGK